MMKTNSLWEGRQIVCNFAHDHINKESGELVAGGMRTRYTQSPPLYSFMDSLCFIGSLTSAVGVFHFSAQGVLTPLQTKVGDNRVKQSDSCLSKEGRND